MIYFTSNLLDEGKLSASVIHILIRLIFAMLTNSSLTSIVKHTTYNSIINHDKIFKYQSEKYKSKFIFPIPCVALVFLKS